MKTALILGGAGFIGTALTNRLVDEGTWVRVLDIKRNPFITASRAADFGILDLRLEIPEWATIDIYGNRFDEVYQLACDVGGAGYIYEGMHDARIMTGNVTINANVIRHFSKVRCGRLFFASSACVYSDKLSNPQIRDTVPLREEDANIMTPSTGYGWEKRFSEQMYLASDLNACIARFSTIYGPGSSFDDGREKAVAAICRKVIDAKDGDNIEVWGDGQQTRPMLYVDDLVTGIIKMARGASHAPTNIATKERMSCDDIAHKAIALSGKRLTIKHVPGHVGKRELNMDTTVAEMTVGWSAHKSFFDIGLERTYRWIEKQKTPQK